MQEPSVKPYRIDVHDHFAPTPRIAAVAGRPLLNVANIKWTPALPLDDMDRGGVAAAMVSITGLGLCFGDRAATNRLARACNDYGRQAGPRPSDERSLLLTARIRGRLGPDCAPRDRFLWRNKVSTWLPRRFQEATPATTR